MIIKQVSVFLDNKSGRLAQMTKIVSDANVNIRALYVADTTDYGILRMIVDDPQKAYNALKEAAFTAHITPVFAISIMDRPGGLAEVLSALDRAGVNVEYLYAFAGRDENQKAAVVIKVSDIDSCKEAVLNSGVEFLTQEDIVRMCR